jgi:hypothetical protein
MGVTVAIQFFRLFCRREPAKCVLLQGRFADQETFSKSQLDFLVDFSSSSQGFLGLLNPVVSVEDRLVNLKRYNGLILTFLILPIGLLIANSRQNYSNYIFFSNDKDHVEIYGDIVYECFLSIKTPSVNLYPKKNCN